MKPRQICCFLLLTMLLVACSGNEGVNRDQRYLPNVAAVNDFDRSEVRLMEIDAGSMEVYSSNLSGALGIDNDYSRLHIDGSNLSFHKSRPNASVWQQNVADGAMLVKLDYFSPDTGQTSFYSTNSDEKLLNFYFTGVNDNGFDIYANIFDLKNESNYSLYIDKTSFIDGLLGNNKLIIKSVNESSVNSITSILIFDLENGELIDRLDMPSEKFRLTSLDDNRLFIFYSDQTYEIYNTGNFELLKTDNYQIPFNVGQISLITEINEHHLVYNYSYAQPSIITAAPAIYNFENQESTIIDLFKLKSGIEQLVDTAVFFTSYKVDLESEILILGFVNIENGETGGLIYADYSAEIIDHVALDHFPTHLIIH